MTITVTKKTSIYKLVDGLGFVCAHPDAYAVRVEGYNPDHQETALICPADDCTGIEDWETAMILGGA